jgi:hypothetical protein
MFIYTVYMFDFYRHGSIWSPTAFNPAKWRINYLQYIGNTRRFAPKSIRPKSFRPQVDSPQVVSPPKQQKVN